MRVTARVGAGALGAVLASGALVGAGAGPAFAAPCTPGTYPPKPCQVVGGNRAGAPPLVVSVTIGRPGTALTASASKACDPGALVTLSLVRLSNGAQPVRLATTTADSNGSFTVSGSIPGDSRPGNHILYATCR
ncbi:MAG: hypothetical protein H7233_12280, partial [Pseudorhodobacter sp.]|nr:hypothetical protein [Frankiaceae bacterium]